MTKKQTIAGTTAAQNQPTQLISKPSPLAANCAHKGFAAIPVINMAPVIGVNWKHVITRNSPMRPCFGPG